MGKKLTKKAKIWVAIGASVAGIAAVTGITIGIMAANGLLEDSGCPIGEHRSSCPLPDPSECPCLTDEQEELRRKFPSVDKPIVYLYPESSTEVTVRLGFPENLTASYPKYADGWRVLAHPDGTLTDLNTDRDLYALYWEGDKGDFQITDEGFVIKGSDTASFLESKLAALGLNSREVEEFIIYWLPQLQGNNYNYIRFASSAEINDYMPLHITPTPTNLIRVLMLTAPLDQPIEVTEQQLPVTPSREGFTVVEWGGSIIK